eukprot:CAMPEP_0172476326 /NCGR_PEP_ID=MMETSP1065-20121228/70320_1 /TAXON_ID=265537 /ORGANISM="Amphiprora paludosa, Strain CCMP125" /LENGTH=210 /DNA_ID=CAMNT_0013234547 /DNA_START=701 /DNA_END=1336 /DNA_ORIENTATION=-
MALAVSPLLATSAAPLFPLAARQPTPTRYHAKAKRRSRQEQLRTQQAMMDEYVQHLMAAAGGTNFTRILLEQEDVSPAKIFSDNAKTHCTRTKYPVSSTLRRTQSDGLGSSLTLGDDTSGEGSAVDSTQSGTTWSSRRIAYHRQLSDSQLLTDRWGTANHLHSSNSLRMPISRPDRGLSTKAGHGDKAPVIRRPRGKLAEHQETQEATPS